MHTTRAFKERVPRGLRRNIGDIEVFPWPFLRTMMMLWRPGKHYKYSYSISNINTINNMDGGEHLLLACSSHIHQSHSCHTTWCPPILSEPYLISNFFAIIYYVAVNIIYQYCLISIETSKTGCKCDENKLFKEKNLNFITWITIFTTATKNGVISPLLYWWATFLSIWHQWVMSFMRLAVSHNVDFAGSQWTQYCGWPKLILDRFQVSVTY